MLTQIFYEWRFFSDDGFFSKKLIWSKCTVLLSDIWMCSHIWLPKRLFCSDTKFIQSIFSKNAYVVYNNLCKIWVISYSHWTTFLYLFFTNGLLFSLIQLSKKMWICYDFVKKSFALSNMKRVENSESSLPFEHGWVAMSIPTKRMKRKRMKTAKSKESMQYWSVSHSYHSCNC